MNIARHPAALFLLGMVLLVSCRNGDSGVNAGDQTAPTDVPFSLCGTDVGNDWICAKEPTAEVREPAQQEFVRADVDVPRVLPHRSEVRTLAHGSADISFGGELRAECLIGREAPTRIQTRVGESILFSQMEGYTYCSGSGSLETFCVGDTPHEGTVSCPVVITFNGSFRHFFGSSGRVDLFVGFIQVFERGQFLRSLEGELTGIAIDVEDGQVSFVSEEPEFVDFSDLEQSVFMAQIEALQSD